MSAARWPSAQAGGWSSWHLLRADGTTTYCGRQARPGSRVPVADVPGDERTCERCGWLSRRYEPSAVPV